VDIATLIFMLSAVSPEKMMGVLERVFSVLRPGGVVLVRDYGVCDLTHVRFLAKNGRKLEENFYLRGDGTRAYFFTIEKITELLQKVGFIIEDAKYDSRELKNRKRKIIMKRIWVHVAARRPSL